MTRADLGRRIHARHGGLTHEQCARAVDRVIETMIEALKRGEPVSVPGFGTLRVVSRKARIGLNPRTREEMRIPERRAAVFRPSKAFLDDVNGIGHRQGDSP